MAWPLGGEIPGQDATMFHVSVMGTEQNVRRGVAGCALLVVARAHHLYRRGVSLPLGCAPRYCPSLTGMPSAATRGQPVGNMSCHCTGSWAACTSPRRIHVAHLSHSVLAPAPHACLLIASPSRACMPQLWPPFPLIGRLPICEPSHSIGQPLWRCMHVPMFRQQQCCYPPYDDMGAHPGAIDIGIGWSPPQVSMVHTLGKDASFRASFSVSAWHRYGHLLFAGKCMRRAPKSALPRLGGVVARAVALAHVALCAWVETQVGPKLSLIFSSYGRVVLPTRSDSRMWMCCGALSVIQVSPSPSLLVVRTLRADSCRHLGGQASAPELGLRPSHSGRIAPLSGDRR